MTTAASLSIKDAVIDARGPHYRTTDVIITSGERPRRVELVEELPLTPAGKVDRRAAKAAFVAKR